jgi:hypothetical protein
MSYRNALVSSISSVVGSVFSEIAPNQPSMPYCVILEEDGTREGTTSGPFITIQVRLDLFTNSRSQGSDMRDEIIDVLEAESEDFWFVVKPSGVDVDTDSQAFIHSVEITITPK